MDQKTSPRHIVIAPQIYIALEPPESQAYAGENPPTVAEIPMIWIQDGHNFRLDIDLPISSVLDLIIVTAISSLHVNGETIWANGRTHSIQMTGAHVESTDDGLRLTCTSGGKIHILACVEMENDSAQLSFD
jgi:hypothetical protein